MSDISDAIETSATGPKRVKGDAGEVEQHSLKDQIEADRYTSGVSAVEESHRGIRFTKFIPRGTQGNSY